MTIDAGLRSTYRNLMNNINSGLLVVDDEYNICICNNWFDDHCEYSMEDKLATSLFDLFPDIKDTRLHDAIASTLENGYPSVVSNIFSPTPFPLYPPKNFDAAMRMDERIQQQVTVSRLEETTSNYCLIQINDVSAAVVRERTLEQEVIERKEIEDALLESDLKHLTIMEKMIDGLIVFSANGQIESFNPASERLFGYAEPEMLGTSVAKLFENLTQDTSDETEELKLNQDFIGSYNEIKAKRHGGELFDVELSISKMQVSGKVFYTAIIRDITERKNIDKMKSEFISTVSHELRTPLTSIRGSLGLLSGGVIDLATEKAKSLVDIAYNNCDRLVLLINDILDMEKYASGGMEFDIKTYNLHELVARSIEDNQSYADHYKVKYHLTAESKMLLTKVDQHRFLQIMANLLSNAAKFSYENSQIDIRIFTSNDHHIIEVQDYGEGIPESFKKTIWRKFTQADASTTRKKGGTGLGLAISQSLVEAMNGEIRFKSQLGEGTTFIVSLPIAD